MNAAAAFTVVLVGAWLVYAASSRGLHSYCKPQTRLWRGVGSLLLIVGARLWIDAEGAGAGLATALTELMLAWVALPYIAWWRQRVPLPEKRRC